MRPGQPGRDPPGAVAAIVRGPVTLHRLLRVLKSARSRGKRIVFTNGVFDILHVGHARYLASARAQGDLLVVGLNSDMSVRRLKGQGRPIVPQAERAELLLSLRAVDHVVIFGSLTPAALIAAIRPDVLVKGADWARNAIMGADTVRASGGRIVRVRLAKGRSTTNIVKRILARLG